MDDTTSNKLLKHYISVMIIGVILTAGIFLSSGYVVSQATTDPAVSAQPIAIIQSRFMLWDEYEKSLDKNFQIILINWDNYSMNYSIDIDGVYTNGSFNNYYVQNYSFVNTNISKIYQLIVYINDTIVLHASDIRIFSGITQGRIDEIQVPYKISFLPFELTQLEWNLVFAGIIGVLISLPVSYATVKYYRKHREARML